MPQWGQGYAWTGDSASRGCKDTGHGRRGWSQALAWTVGQHGTLNPGWSQSQALAWRCESEKRVLCPGSGSHARLWAGTDTEPWGRVGVSVPGHGVWTTGQQGVLCLVWEGQDRLPAGRRC